MDALFGEVDAVQEGEKETAANKMEAMTYTREDLDEKTQVTMHLEESKTA